MKSGRIKVREQATEDSGLDGGVSPRATQRQRWTITGASGIGCSSTSLVVRPIRTSARLVVLVSPVQSFLRLEPMVPGSAEEVGCRPMSGTVALHPSLRKPPRTPLRLDLGSQQLDLLPPRWGSACSSLTEGVGLDWVGSAHGSARALR